MTDRELMQWALDALDGYARNCRCEGGGAPCDAAEALRARLAEPEPEVRWDASAPLVVHSHPAFQTIEALRARLAQPEPEPVALGDSSYDVDFRDDGTISVSLPDGDELVIVPPQPKQKDLEPYCYTWDKWISSGTWEAQYGWKPYYGGKRPEHVTDAKPLYATPPQREFIGLTDEEIDETAWPYFIGNIMPSVKLIVRRLEAKLREKNHAI